MSGTFGRRLVIGAFILSWVIAIQEPTARAASTVMQGTPTGMVEAGAPAFAVYSPRALGLSANPSDFRILPDGRVVLLAGNEIAIGDGVRWRLFRAAEGQTAAADTQMAMDDNGDLYVGVAGGFARIEYNDDGRWSLKRVATLPAGIGNAPVPMSRVDDGGAKWLWNSGSGPVVEWRPGTKPRLAGFGDGMEWVFEFNGENFTSTASTGELLRLGMPGNTKVTFDRAPLGRDGILSSLNTTSGRMFVGTVGAGLRIFDGSNMTALVREGPLADGSQIAGLCEMAPGLYAAAVDAVGIVFFDQNGKTLQVLDRLLDHRLARARKLRATKDGVLWALLSDGIAAVQFPAQVSQFEPLIASGLVYAKPLRYEGRLWMITDSRLLRGIYDQSGRLLRFENDSPPGRIVYRASVWEGSLVVTTETGIFRHERDGWRLLVPDIVNARVGVTSTSNNRSLYVARNEIGWMIKNGYEITADRMPVPDLGSVHHTFEDKAGLVWLELGSGRVGCIDPSHTPLTVQIYGTNDGLYDSWVQLFCFEGRVYASVAEHILKFDDASGRFVPATELLARFPELRTSVGHPATDLDGGLWVTVNGEPRLIREHPAPGTPRELRIPVGFIPWEFTLQDDGVVWMWGRNRLARFDPKMPRAPQVEPRVLITSVQLSASGRYIFTHGDDLGSFDFEDNSFEFNLAAPANSFVAPVTLDVTLEGAEKQQVFSGTVGSISFNRLKEGSYIMHVRPVAGGREGEEAHLAFHVRPPWYRTTIARIATGTAAVGLIAAVAWLVSYLERREKLRLEHLVRERTRETMAKADALAASEERYRCLNTELEGRVRDRTTELATANTELVRAKEAAEAADHAKGAFLANMSHEIRTPMGGMISIGHLLLTTPLNADQRDLVDTLLSSGESLLTILNDILDFSKIEAGSLKLESIDFLVGKHVEQAVRLYAETSRKKNLTLTSEIDPGIPARLNGDPVRLRQIVLNLVGNAIKFTARGGVNVRARLVHSAETGSTVRFEVTDTGIGIKRETQRALFRRFVQADNSTTRKFGGTGLGLAICRSLVELMGGQIGVTSEPGRGATFWFEIPFAPSRLPHHSDVPPSGPAAPEQTEPVPLARVGEAMRILVAEDNVVNQKLAARFLTNAGFITDLAADGREAIDAIRRHPYALVLMDVQMPVLDGLEATRCIRRAQAAGEPGFTHAIRIIAMTANAMSGDREVCLAAGMDDYITKPISPSTLNQVLKQYVGPVVEAAHA